MGQNGAPTGINLREYVDQISQDLTERIHHQRTVLLKFIEDNKNQGQRIDYCPLIDCQPKQRLREGIREAILVLEETRRAFKSRRLEELRLKLESLLVEDSK